MKRRLSDFVAPEPSPRLQHPEPRLATANNGASSGSNTSHTNANDVIAPPLPASLNAGSSSSQWLSSQLRETGSLQGYSVAVEQGQLPTRMTPIAHESPLHRAG